MCAKSDDEADFNSGVAVGRRRTERRTGAKFLTPFCLSSLLPPSVLPIVRTNARNRVYLPHTDQPLTATCSFFSLPVIPLSLLLLSEVPKDLLCVSIVQFVCAVAIFF